MKYLFCVVCTILSFGTMGQEATSAGSACMATAVMPDQYKTEIISYYIYTGDKADAPYTKDITVELRPSKTMWKRMPDPNCPSGTPEDCMIWTPVESEGESIDLTVVTNIEKQTNYFKQQFSRQKLVKEGGYEKQVPVICDKDITPSLMYNVSMRLTDMGYYSGLIYNVLNSKIKSALEKFQKHNELPIGHLNKPTIEALELDWPYDDESTRDIKDQ